VAALRTRGKEITSQGPNSAAGLCFNVELRDCQGPPRRRSASGEPSTTGRLWPPSAVLALKLPCFTDPISGTESLLKRDTQAMLEVGTNPEAIL